jgi:16S rRNA (guanine966-N2)-methyltransferase
MRIISGINKGLRLAAVGKGDAAAHLRPTADRVRESLFNVLGGGTHGDPITRARVLDLFAGTGALGLEALSRGAANVTFVDDGTKALTLLRENVRLCRAEGHTTILRRNATRLGRNPDGAFDLVFLDPPYGKNLGEKALGAARAGGWLAADALVVFEENQPVAPGGFTVLDSRRYGDTHVTLLEPAA